MHFQFIYNMRCYYIYIQLKHQVYICLQPYNIIRMIKCIQHQLISCYDWTSLRTKKPNCKNFSVLITCQSFTFGTDCSMVVAPLSTSIQDPYITLPNSAQNHQHSSFLLFSFSFVSKGGTTAASIQSVFPQSPLRDFPSLLLTLNNGGGKVSAV